MDEQYDAIVLGTGLKVIKNLFLWKNDFNKFF